MGAGRLRKKSKGMNMLHRLSTTARLGCGFGLMSLLLAATVWLAENRLDALDDMVERIVGKDWAKVVLANEVLELADDNAQATFELFLISDRRPALERIEANKRTITEKLDTVESKLYLPEGKALLAKVRAARQPYVASFSEVNKLLAAGKQTEASRRMIEETLPALNQFRASIEALIKFQGKILEETGAASHATYRAAFTALLLFLGLAIVVAVISAVLIIRSVVVPLGGEPQAVKEIVRRIAAGDLSVEINDKEAHPESLLIAVSAMQKNLNSILGNLNADAQHLSVQAEQLSTASSQVAAGSTHQSEAASSMAAAVEQMTVSINHVAGSADEAQQLTARTGELACEGDRIIAETVKEMKDIASTADQTSGAINVMAENARRISGVVQVIKEVADQTNLLALNAAIEAARAGEQGRGFAVVADEVRGLAERTAKATTEISAMIASVQESAEVAVASMRRTVEQVDQGVGLASNATGTMRDINAEAQRVVSVIHEMTSALKEQGVASNEIAGNVEKVAQMSEENSAASTETAGTARRLEELAGAMRAAVSQFKLASARG